MTTPLPTTRLTTSTTRMSTLRLLTAWLLLSVALAVGCSPRMGVPRLEAGPLDYQRRMAHQFDPYPDNTVGPKLDGSRPREYSAPPPEAQKARWVRSSPRPPAPLR